jgi:hypothetical protein
VTETKWGPIHEGDVVVILKYDCRRKFSSHNLAKDALFGRDALRVLNLHLRTIDCTNNFWTGQY